jgi:hypothetical protein
MHWEWPSIWHLARTSGGALPISLWPPPHQIGSSVFETCINLLSFDLPVYLNFFSAQALPVLAAFVRLLFLQLIKFNLFPKKRKKKLV